MLSPIPAFRQMASGGLFLAAFLLAAPNTLMAAQTPQIQELDSKQAAKHLIHVEKPDYPPIAKVNFIRGSVNLQIEVSSAGRVDAAHVIQGEPILAAAALQAVRKWLYRPYHSEGVPVPFTTYVTVKFNLHPHTFRGRLPTGAEDYLEKQVRPPEVISRPQPTQSTAGIQMKVLVGAEGKVMDATSIKAGQPGIDVARESLQSWKFRPARWGAIAVPWYVRVTVPLPYVALDQAASSAKH